MTAADIATALGDAHREGRDWRCRYPLHGGRSLVLTDGHEGRLLVRCWGGCDAHDILAELRQRRLTSAEIEARPTVIAAASDGQLIPALPLAQVHRA